MGYPHLWNPPIYIYIHILEYIVCHIMYICTYTHWTSRNCPNDLTLVPQCQRKSMCSIRSNFWLSQTRGLNGQLAPTIALTWPIMLKRQPQSNTHICWALELHYTPQHLGNHLSHQEHLLWFTNIGTFTAYILFIGDQLKTNNRNPSINQV